MRIETLLSKCLPLKSFAYSNVRLAEGKFKDKLVVTIRPRKNGVVLCSCCSKECSVYDHLTEREFDFVPLWNIPVGFEYKMLRFFFEFGTERTAVLKFICSDMWALCLKVIRKKAPHALNILDRFHIVGHLTKAVNQVRVDEVKKLKQDGADESVLRHTKYCFLKPPGNLTDKQQVKLDDVLEYDLKSVRAYLLKESFQLFWNYTSPYWAEWFLGAPSKA